MERATSNCGGAINPVAWPPQLRAQQKAGRQQGEGQDLRPFGLVEIDRRDRLDDSEHDAGDERDQHGLHVAELCRCKAGQQDRRHHVRRQEVQMRNQDADDARDQRRHAPGHQINADDRDAEIGGGLAVRAHGAQHQADPRPFRQPADGERDEKRENDDAKLGVAQVEAEQCEAAVGDDVRKGIGRIGAPDLEGERRPRRRGRGMCGVRPRVLDASLWRAVVRPRQARSRNKGNDTEEGRPTMTGDADPIRSDIAWSTRDRIVVCGKDLPGEIIGHLDLGAFAFLQITARMTYLGAPEAMQAAVAAGLCGLGSVFVGSTEDAARMLLEELPQGKPPADLAAAADAVVAAFRQRGEAVPGLGHPVHKPLDPRSVRLFALAEECGYSGPYVALMQEIAAAAARASQRSLPVNATGAVGALCCELGLPVQAVRGIGVIARAVGLVGHILEEAVHPMAREVWRRTEEAASAHLRPT